MSQFYIMAQDAWSVARPIEVGWEVADTVLLVVQNGAVHVTDEDHVAVFVDGDMDLPLLVGLTDRAREEVGLCPASVIVR